MVQRVTAIALLVVIAGALVAVYRVVQSRMAVDVYRQRLEKVGQAYQALATTYNDVVKKTAVTELLVEKGVLHVAVRNVEGILRKIETPYDPMGEIYVDYIVARGRLWIRRVYDNKTAPIEGLVIDPKWAAINWDEAESTIGKAVYRRLTEGRWIVTVTGDGSLGLARIDGPVELATPPRIRDYEELRSDLSADLERIGPTAVLEKLIVPEG